MKCFRLICITCLTLLWSVAVWAEAGPTQGKTPLIFIKEKVYTFEQVLEGTDVRHDFIIHNNGDAVLKIEKVDST